MGCIAVYEASRSQIRHENMKFVNLSFWPKAEFRAFQNHPEFCSALVRITVQ